MKKYTLFLSVFTLFITLLGFNVNTASATPFPQGCASASGYSPTTGIKCDSVVDASLPPGCQPGFNFSSTTGQRCGSGSNFLPGCFSNQGYSITTGEPCGRTTTQPSITLISQNITAVAGETIDKAIGEFRFKVFSPSIIC